jgi:hypothetical protein
MQRIISPYFTAQLLIHNLIRHNVIGAETHYRPTPGITESESLRDAVLFLNNDLKLIRDTSILTDRHDIE